MDSKAASKTGSPVKPGQRIEWLDVVKGLAIALVVYGHVMQGVAAEGGISKEGFEAFSEAFVYSFHMPAFFFVSGLLSAKALEGNLGKYIRDKAESIAWPYVVWTVLNLVAYSLFVGFYHHHPKAENWGDLWTYLWNPHEFWFLYTLFCVQIFMIITVWVRIEIVCFFSIVGFIFAGSVHAEAVDKFLFFLPFFAGGVMGRCLLSLTKKGSGWDAYVAAAILFIFQAAIICWVQDLRMAALLILGFMGTYGLIALAVGTNGTLFAAIFSRLGAASLGIFLMHTYFQGMSRLAIEHFLGIHGWLSVVLQTVISVIVPAFLYELMMSCWLRYLFALKPVRKK